MTAIYPGSAHIHCYTYLAHARFETGTVHSFILDGAIPAMNFGDQASFFSGSFRYYDYADVIRPLGSPHYYEILDAPPATVHCSGYVFLVDESSDSFLVTVWQNIIGNNPLTPLTVRAIMSVFENVTQPLPELYTTVSFCGELVTVEDSMTVVAVRDHSYFASTGAIKYEET
ncbi:hypothetical protein V8E53_011309 [Lactarius tabidus]